MKEGFRQAMAWLHTWAGLIFGWLLLAIFLSGTLAYFKDEISHWMQPEIPARSLSSEASLTLAQQYLEQHAAGASRWLIDFASMSGLMVAVAAFFWANRLLPVGMAGRADWEVNSFFIVWGLSVLHAMVRRGRAAWVEQLALAALLFCAVPLLNALTTPYHLSVTLIQGDWAMAGSI